MLIRTTFPKKKKEIWSLFYVSLILFLKEKPLDFTDTLYVGPVPCAAIDFKKSSSKKTYVSITFRKHPKDPTRMIVWISKINRKN